MKYRREIDGLRAVAVIPVILFHAGYEAFGGGFIGVDVFFVISGYLITSIIIGDLDAGRFSLARFYERRARRILPALFFVMLCCLPAAWFLFFPTDMQAFAKSLLAVATFSSNILFWRESGYFDTASELKPLLHTWSLAVEEQYYILFPLFLMAAWRFGRRRIVATLIVLFAASLGAAQWGAQAKPSATFYLLPTRAWELLIGALAAFHLQKKGIATGRALNDVLSAGGLTLIVLAVVVFDKGTPFPSLYALAPTVGTALIILFAGPGTRVRALLSMRGFVGIGLISYSLYLWHQPLLAFSRQAEMLYGLEISFPIQIVPALVALSCFSYFFVERPFRFRVKRIGRGGAVVLAGGALAFIGFAVNFAFDDRLQLRHSATQIARYHEFRELRRQKTFCIARFTQIDPQICAFGPPDGAPHVVAVGDSHMGQWADILKELAEEEGARIELVTKASCAIAEVDYVYPEIGRDYRECWAWRRAVLDRIAARPPDVVLMTGASQGYTPGLVSVADWTAGLRELSTQLLSVNRMIWLYDNPRFSFNVWTCFERSTLNGLDPDRCTVPLAEARNPQVRAAEASVFADVVNLETVDFTDYFCDEDRCVGMRDGAPLMSDSNHVSQYAAQELKDRLRAALFPR